MLAHRRIMLLAGICALTPVRTGIGQTVTVQQPVFRNFNVNTTVSVPDRGSALLGGVSRAGSTRTTTGPFRNGSSAGHFTEHFSTRASVTILDLHEMDRQILNGADGLAEPRAPVLSANARQAYDALIARNQKRGRTGSDDRLSQQIVVRSPAPAVSSRRTRSRLNATYLRLAESAVAARNYEKARYYFQRAGEFGASEEADKPALSGQKLSVASRPTAKIRPSSTGR